MDHEQAGNVVFLHEAGGGPCLTFILITNRQFLRRVRQRGHIRPPLYDVSVWKNLLDVSKADGLFLRAPVKEFSGIGINFGRFGLARSTRPGYEQQPEE